MSGRWWQWTAGVRPRAGRGNRRGSWPGRCSPRQARFSALLTLGPDPWEGGQGVVEPPFALGEAGGKGRAAPCPSSLPVCTSLGLGFLSLCPGHDPMSWRVSTPDTKQWCLSWPQGPLPSPQDLGSLVTGWGCPRVLPTQGLQGPRDTENSDGRGVERALFPSLSC